MLNTVGKLFEWVIKNNPENQTEASANSIDVYKFGFRRRKLKVNTIKEVMDTVTRIETEKGTLRDGYY